MSITAYEFALLKCVQKDPTLLN